jgi:RecJ-like exonuclease
MQLRASVAMINVMKISSITCPNCRAAYEVAESTSATGCPGRAVCAICGEFLTSWQEPKLRVFRLTVPPEHKYPRVLPPSSPA